jgi:serine/threonine protein kinase
MSNNELDLTSLSPTDVARLHKLMDAGSTELERLADNDVQLCLAALLGTNEVSSTTESSSTNSQSANSRFSNPRFVGSGSFGIVYFVLDLSLGMDVAIKLLRPSRNSPIAKQRFLEEARITAHLTHPGIIRLFDSGTIGQIPYITSTIVSGGSLAEWIAKNPQGMDPETACRILLAVAEAVAFAHSKLTYHRDIKPSNILMSEEGQPVLTDFGLAKRWDKTEAALTLEGDILGTARYMSPEQACGALEDYSVVSEVFTLGIILQELLTGRCPFEGKNSTEIRKSIISERPISLKQHRPTISSDLVAIIQKCLEKVAEHRYESVAALVKDLQRHLGGQPVEASSPSVMRMLLWKAKSHPVVSSLSAIAFVTVFSSIVAVGYSWWNQLQIAKHERQTKIEYVVLFGKLVDDVVAGEKNQQEAILESLQGFQSAIERDLLERPTDQDLRHLLSLVFHYQSVTYSRLGKQVEAMQSRIESVSILQKLRFEFPANSKYRFQYLYGLMSTCETIDYSIFSELLSRLAKETGFKSGVEIADAAIPEMDLLQKDFSKPTYEDAVNQFRLNIAKTWEVKNPERARDLVIRAIKDSKSLADRHPDTITYINPAIRGYWILAKFAGRLNDPTGTLAYAQEATQCFDEHLGEHMDKVWVQSMFIEQQYWHVDTFFSHGKYAEAIELSEKCLKVNSDRLENAAFRLNALIINFRLHATRHLIFQAENRSAEAEQELANTQTAARMAMEFDYSKSECLAFGELMHLPESLLSILREVNRENNPEN